MAHRDYQRAPAHHQWQQGTLTELWARMNTMLRWKQREPLHGELRVWFVLWSGALVALRLDGEQRICRIARSEKPKTDDGPELWEKEIATFVRFFGLGPWARVDEPEAKGVAVLFLEPTAPVCGSCHTPLDQDARQFGRTLCTGCQVSSQRNKEHHELALALTGGG